MPNIGTHRVPPDPALYRLPVTVLPERYEICIAPNLEEYTFRGNATISITVVEPVHELVLNAVELIINTVTVSGSYGKIIAGLAYPDEATERVVLALPQTLQPGAWLLNISFRGLLNDKLHGFYRSTYKDQAGRNHILACTQFQSTDARRAFPCWDEPVFKAVFKTTLEIDEHLQAISNTAIVEETVVPATGKKKVVFADSMRMSTYLVAFIVGQFQETDPVMVKFLQSILRA